MLESNHFEILERLRFSKSGEERQQALKDLIVREQSGDFDEKDLLSLLENEDTVYQTYAIGALGRLRMDNCTSQLKSVFLKSNNPLILAALLDAFVAYDTDEFVPVVLKKMKNPTRRPWFKKKNLSLMESVFDDEMILDQILVPSLKYFQIAGNRTVGKAIEPYLDHEDSMVRWHTLVAFDKLDIPLNDDRLAKIQTTDEDILVKEQVKIMRDKRYHF